MKILAQTRDGKDGLVGNVAALGENDISQSRGSVDDPFHSTVRDSDTGREIQYAQVLVGLGQGQREEGALINQLTVCEAQFAEGLTLH